MLLLRRLSFHGLPQARRTPGHGLLCFLVLQVMVLCCCWIILTHGIVLLAIDPKSSLAEHPSFRTAELDRGSEAVPSTPFNACAAPPAPRLLQTLWESSQTRGTRREKQPETGSTGSPAPPPLQGTGGAVNHNTSAVLPRSFGVESTDVHAFRSPVALDVSVSAKWMIPFVHTTVREVQARLLECVREDVPSPPPQDQTLWTYTIREYASASPPPLQAIHGTRRSSGHSTRPTEERAAAAVAAECPTRRPTTPRKAPVRAPLMAFVSSSVADSQRGLGPPVAAFALRVCPEREWSASPTPLQLELFLREGKSQTGSAEPVEACRARHGPSDRPSSRPARCYQTVSCSPSAQLNEKEYALLQGDEGTWTNSTSRQRCASRQPATEAPVMCCTAPQWDEPSQGSGARRKISPSQGLSEGELFVREAFASALARWLGVSSSGESALSCATLRNALEALEPRSLREGPTSSPPSDRPRTRRAAALAWTRLRPWQTALPLYVSRRLHRDDAWATPEPSSLPPVDDAASNTLCWCRIALLCPSFLVVVLSVAHYRRYRCSPGGKKANTRAP